MKALIENVNIRGCERKTNKNGDEYLLIRFEESNGQAQQIVDKDMEREQYYKRGTDMNLTINIDISKNYTNLRVLDAKVI